jgi:hypothetical protein
MRPMLVCLHLPEIYDHKKLICDLKIKLFIQVEVSFESGILLTSSKIKAVLMPLLTSAIFLSS